MVNNKVKYNILVFLGILVIAASSLAIISYGTSILNVISDFVSSNGASKLNSCGVDYSRFDQIKNDTTTLLFPAIYVGVPLLMIVLSVIMFYGGVYYNQAKLADEAEHRQKIEAEIIKKVAASKLTTKLKKEDES